jgi:nicotinamide riboside kinase
MKKKEYMKPEQEVVVMKYSQMLCGSLTSIDSSLTDEDELIIDDTVPITDEFWGR